MSDTEALTQLFDTMPIYATRIGSRTDSTDSERAFGDFLFEVHQNWLGWKEEQA